MKPNVRSLRSALKAYWRAENPREEQAAYHEILLFGGCDGYRVDWRSKVARWLRCLAVKVDGVDA